MTCGSRLSASSGEGERGAGWRDLLGQLGRFGYGRGTRELGCHAKRKRAAVACCCRWAAPRVGLLRVGLEGRIGVDGLGITGLGFEKGFTSNGIQT
jgi:hypothetical protein